MLLLAIKQLLLRKEGIQSESGKIRARITPNTNTFYAVYDHGRGPNTIEHSSSVAVTDGNKLANILSTMGFNYDGALAQKLFLKAIETGLTNESIESKIKKTFDEKP